MNPTQVSELLTGVLTSFGLELEAVEIAPSGRRSRVRVVVDGDGPDGRGPGLDDIAEATRAVSAALDASDVTGAAPYTLEVTSRGVSRPLTAPQHWRRNRGRLIEVHCGDTPPVTGRIVDGTETTATLDVDGAELAIDLDTVTNAVIQVEFTRARRHLDASERDEVAELEDQSTTDDETEH